jgi:hypothetical protein
MLVTESGMVTDDRLVHDWNAEPPMVDTESGMVHDGREIGALEERTTGDAGDGIRDANRCHAGTRLKRIAADAGD